MFTLVGEVLVTAVHMSACSVVFIFETIWCSKSQPHANCPVHICVCVCKCALDALTLCIHLNGGNAGSGKDCQVLRRAGQRGNDQQIFM